ncbi:MAG: hypothetical protein AB7V14_03470 [Kiritimatiellia bacterium]
MARCRWPLLVAGLMALYGWQMVWGEWVYDFWDYSAGIRELMRDLGAPRHPLLPLDAPHFSYSPYLVVLAWLGRWVGGAPIQILAGAGLFNLGLMLAGLRLFIAGTGCPHPRAATFYALLLWLLLWGPGAWYFSAFYHLGSLFSVLPYPSSFAFGLSWILLWQAQQKPTAVRAAAMGLMAGVVALTHPVTFMFLTAGLAGLVFQSGRFAARNALQAAVVLGIAVAVASLWPYFPFWRMIFSDEGSAYMAAYPAMYTAVLARTWPIWACLPLLWLGPGTFRCPAISVAIALLALLYGYGWFSGHLVFGRTISHIALLIQLRIAMRMAAWEQAVFQPGPSRARRGISAAAIVGVLALGLIGSWSAILDRIAMVVHSSTPAYRAYESLAEFLGPGDVVICDTLAGNEIPTFGGKVVCPWFDQLFIPDMEERRRDLRRLYENGAGTDDWKEIAGKWGATCILVLKNDRFAERMAVVSGLGETVFERDEYALVRIDRERLEGGSQ